MDKLFEFTISVIEVKLNNLESILYYLILIDRTKQKKEKLWK